MVSKILSILATVWFLILLPAVWADFCSGYWNNDGFYNENQPCTYQHCCGSCTKKFCCSEKKYRLSQDEQERCLTGTYSERKINIALILGSIFGAIIPILICVSLVICCVAPCCLFYKKCRKRRNQGQQTMTPTTVIYGPQQPLSPPAHQPSYPGYQPVPAQPGYGGSSNPTAPPPLYAEATYPVHSTDGHPMDVYPIQPYSPTLPLDELAQPPYNPSYGLNPTA